MLLADVFEKFINICLEYYGLDPCHYFSSPYGGFKWLNKKEINKFYLNSISENSSIGYISQVDLEYPDEVHCIMIIH